MRANLMVIAGLVPLVFMATVAPSEAQDAGDALRFDGSTDLVRLHPTDSMMAPTWRTTKTVSVWVRPTGSAMCTGPEPALCDAVFGDRPRTWGISRGTINGQDRLWIWNYDGTFDRVGIEYTAGTWTQVTLVHENGVLSAYKDGAFVGSVASGATAQAAGRVLYVGGIISNPSRNWTFEGEIDEVQLWDVGRSSAQIVASMTGPLFEVEPGLAAYYRMSNGSGTALTDDSGYGWTGALLDGGSGVDANGPIEWVVSGAFGAGSTPNTPPIADGQSLTTLEDTAVALTLSGADADADPLTFRVTVPPTFGVLSGAAPYFTYTPVENFYGADSFTFVANDGRIDSEPATVNLILMGVDDPPMATADTSTTAVDTSVSIPVLANDSDVDGDPLTVDAVTQPLHGTTSNEFAHVMYLPEAGFTGTDTFTYTVADGHGGFATATVTVTVAPPGANPGYALRFDGVSDYVRLGRTSEMMAAGWQTTKTVSLWVKPEGTTPFCSAQSPLHCDAIFGDRPRWWGISIGVINGMDRIWVWNNTVAGDQIIAVPYTPGEWLHIALVHGEGQLSAYKNGALIGSVTSGATLQPNTTGQPVLHFGGIINNAARNWTFKGDIDEVQVWNRARTADEIRQDMMFPLSGAELGLAAYYRMSEGAGTLVTDESGHGWTGTLWDGGIEVPADGPILWVPSGAFSMSPQ